MAKLNGFNPNDYDTSAGTYDPIPKGNYTAEITDSEMRLTRDETGKYLNLTFQIIQGEFSGRLVWAMLNLENKNPDAVTYAKRDLAKICKAVGFNRPVDDSVSLHNKPLIITVAIQPPNNGYEAKNVVKNYRAVEGPSVNSTATSSGIKAPWEQAESQPALIPQSKGSPHNPPF